MNVENTHTTELGNGRMPDHPAQAARYAIRVRGHLDPRWSEWLDGLTITCTESFDSILSGTIADQAALHGLLAKIRDLNLTLVSVMCLEAGPPNPGR